jgi:hypothetical protein
MRAPDAFQDKPSSQKATGSRRQATNTHNSLVRVPAVSLSYIFVRASRRRGGRLRPLPATPTKGTPTPTPAQDTCIWCTNRFHRLKPKFFQSRYVGDFRSYEDIRKGAEGGCHICSLVATGATAVFGRIEEDWNIGTTLVMGMENLEFTVMFEMMDPETWRFKNFQFCSPRGNVPEFLR